MLPFIELPLIGTVPTFFLAISLAVTAGLLYTYYATPPKHLAPKNVSDLNLVLIFSAFLGARVFHVLYEEPAHYLQNPQQIFLFWYGGFVFFGGLIGAIIGGHIYAWRKKWSGQQYLETYDYYAPATALTYALGRLGCLLNGCCFGKTCDAWFAIEGRWPTTLTTAVIELGIFLLLLKIPKNKGAGAIFFTWLPLHALNRLLMESQRADFRGPEYILSISSWFAVLLLAAALIYWIKFYRAPAQQAGK